MGWDLVFLFPRKAYKLSLCFNCEARFLIPAAAEMVISEEALPATADIVISEEAPLPPTRSLLRLPLLRFRRSPVLLVGFSCLSRGISISSKELLIYKCHSTTGRLEIAYSEVLIRRTFLEVIGA